ncbi:MAG TPA: fibronectin type III domain-containing protein [Mycobacteriales bacterium]|nr:fibronectin type III domain-containing protein [Mycobacteriales bacterium]
MTLGVAALLTIGALETSAGASPGVHGPIARHATSSKALPSAPRHFSVRAAGTHTAVLTWRPPKRTGGSSIVGYRLEARCQVGHCDRTKTVSGSARSGTISGIKVSDCHEYSVRARTHAGYGKAVSTTTEIESGLSLVCSPIGGQ